MFLDKRPILGRDEIPVLEAARDVLIKTAVQNGINVVCPPTHVSVVSTRHDGNAEFKRSLEELQRKRPNYIVQILNTYSEGWYTWHFEDSHKLVLLH